MFDLFATMEPGGAAVEVNRALRSVQEYIREFRLSEIAAGVDIEFTARRSRPGWTRIWRVK